MASRREPGSGWSSPGSPPASGSANTASSVRAVAPPMLSSMPPEPSATPRPRSPSSPARPSVELVLISASNTGISSGRTPATSGPSTSRAEGRVDEAHADRRGVDGAVVTVEDLGRPDDEAHGSQHLVDGGEHRDQVVEVGGERHPADDQRAEREAGVRLLGGARSAGSASQRSPSSTTSPPAREIEATVTVASATRVLPSTTSVTAVEWPPSTRSRPGRSTSARRTSDVRGRDAAGAQGDAARATAPRPGRWPWRRRRSWSRSRSARAAAGRPRRRGRSPRWRRRRAPRARDWRFS